MRLILTFLVGVLIGAFMPATNKFLTTPQHNEAKQAMKQIACAKKTPKGWVVDQSKIVCF